MDWDVKILTPLSDQPTGWQHVSLRFNHFSQALRSLFELGGAAGVLSPESLKLSLIDHAHQTIQSHEV
jgi:kynureninase